MDNFLFISLGAILGANTRYWMTDWVANKWGTQMPYGTFLINVTGSFILGFIITWAGLRTNLDPRLHRILIVGFLGSYTTFSTYANESITLILDGRFGSGAWYLIGSALLGGIAAFAGILLARQMAQQLAV
jgi:CrcB protein